MSLMDQEDHVVNADENKPPSPLSVQHDSGLLPVQSPPFDNDLVEQPPSTISDYSNELELDARIVSPANSDIEDTQPCTTTTWGSVGNQPEQAKAESPTKTIDTTTPNSKSILNLSNPMSEYTEAVKRSEPGTTRPSAQISSPSRTAPVKKSVQQLYGQPSWWGDGEDNYSYPHTSLLGSKEPAEIAEKDVPSDIPQVEPDAKPQPRSEAFVIDFGPNRGTGESPGTLSQCIPDRLRRGFDERERLKREREKENELRRQTLPAESSPMRQNSQRSTRSVTLRAANAKLAATGRPSTASAGTARVNRPSCSTGTRPSTAATGRRTAGSTNPSTALRTPKSGQTTGSSDLTPRRATGSVPSSPLVRTSRNSGSASVTPRQSNLSTTREVVDGAINRVSALQTTVTRAGVASGRRPTVGSSGPSGTPRRLSHRTDVSNASRRTAPPGSIQPMGTIMTKTGLTVAARTPKAPTKPTTTIKTGGGSQSTTTRNFMSATASSGAKRVQPSLSNRPPTGTVTHSQSRTSAVTAGPVPSNSVKRPVTSTQLRRPASSTRAPVRRTSTDIAEKYRCVTSRGNLMRATSDVIDNVMATIDAYDDPKAYLFYRMFQGADETEPSTDSVFKTFIVESPSELTSKRGATIGAVPEVELNAALAQKDWLLNTGDKEGRTLTSPNLASPSMMKPSLEDAKNACSPTTPQEQSPPQQPPDALGSQSKLTHLTNITQPTISSSSPKVQHRLFPKSTEHAVNVSMLVGTSVASLAGTYILEKGTTLAERDSANAPVDGDLRGSVSLVRSHDRGSMDQVYLLGNLSRLQETEEERVDSNPDSRRRTALDSTAVRSSFGMGPLARNDPVCQRLRRRPNVTSALTGSADLPTTSADACTNNARGRQGTIATNTTHSSGALLDTCKDDMELDRTEAPILSADGLNTSMLVSASVTSLAPSLAATYVLDVDDTLAAQGLVPAVVIQSREDLLLSPTKEVRTVATRVSRGSRLAEVSMESSLTPRASPNLLNRDGLWDVLETEECTEEAELKDFSRKDDTLRRTREISNDEQGSGADVDEEVECYRSLPNPSATQDATRSRQDVEAARSHRTYVTGDALTVGTTQALGEETGHRLIPTPVRSAGDGSRTQSGSITPGKIILNAVEAKHSPSPGSGVPRGQAVLLKRPERSPSTSSTPPSAEIVNDSLPSTAHASSPFNTTQVSQNGDTIPPKPCVSPELANGPRSTYTPLTDIHNCYRALQQSVNFLIQSQSGLLPNYNDEDVTGFGLAGTTLTSEYEQLPLRVGQNAASHSYQTTESRLPCSSAAVWPPDLMHLGATGTRRSLSQRHRADRKRQSTASLDSALQRWDDSRAETPQLKHRSFRGPKSTGTHGMHKTFLFKSGEDPEALRLSSAMDRNIMASGDSGLQSYSASLSQSDRKSHLTVLDQAAHLTRTHAFRTGFASVPEPASPTGSGSSHSATNGWSAARRPQLLPEPNRLVPPGSGDAVLGAASLRTVNPLNRTYDFTAQNGPLILSRGLHVPECGPEGDKDASGGPTATKVPGGTEAPTFDSRTFTRRKGVHSTDQNETPTVDPSSYQALVAGMSAISQGIDSLAKAPLFRTVADSNALRLDADQTGSASDLPDSTTGPPTEKIRSAFVTPIPQRSLGIPYAHPSASLSADQTGGNQIPEDSSTYYTLMVDSIRHLSLKLRQCSDKLIQRVNAEQNAAQLSSPTDRRTSRASSTDSVPASTKFALSDALENMRMINQQLKMVDELLFTQNWNELHQSQQNMSRSVTGNGTPGNLGQNDTNHFSFVPIGRDNPVQSMVGRALHPSVKSATQTKTSTFVLPGQVAPHGQTVRPSVEEEDEYY